MFSFTWLFRLWSKNHSNFNRLWISPTLFLLQKEICHWFQAACIQAPQKKCYRLFDQGTTGKWDGCCKAPSIIPASALCKQTSSVVCVCFFQIWCVKTCTVNIFYFIQLLDLMKITKFSVIYTGKPIYTPWMLKWFLCLKYLICYRNYVVLKSPKKCWQNVVLLLHSHA